MENKSGLHPVGRTVLVLLAEVPQKHGMITLHETTIERDQMAQIHATLIETGPLAWRETPQALVPTGSSVVIKRYAGEYVTGVDSIKYRIINDTDIYAIRDFNLPVQGA